MNKSFAVIGAQFGDEGKGAMTNYLAKTQPNAVVIRFNGGAQAGHTVEENIDHQSVRHVFGHIGSGFFQYAPTWCAPEFICNPLLFYKEKNQLLYTLEKSLLTELADNIKIQIHPDCRITTVYDMFVNQIIERARGQNAHGSCGVGILETVKRFEDANTHLHMRFKDLSDPKRIRDFCTAIREQWVPRRLQALGLELDMQTDILPQENRLVAQFVEAAHNFYLDNVLAPRPIARQSEVPPTYIFEGAQGLMLDQELGVMPHLTPSFTGIPNVVSLKTLLGLDEVEVYYMSRVYTTRHGNGPLKNELSDKPYPGVVDNTNITNAYQGSLRFAYLDLDELGNFITRDTQRNSALHLKPKIVLTCTDQLGDNQTVHYYQNNEAQVADFDQFLGICFEHFQMNILFTQNSIYEPKAHKKQQLKLVA